MIVQGAGAKVAGVVTGFHKRGGGHRGGRTDRYTETDTDIVIAAAARDAAERRTEQAGGGKGGGDKEVDEGNWGGNGRADKEEEDERDVPVELKASNGDIGKAIFEKTYE